jgi:putative endonuclease
MKQPALYIMASKPNGTLHIGFTSNLLQRVYQHRQGLTGGFTSRLLQATGLVRVTRGVDSF